MGMATTSTTWQAGTNSLTRSQSELIAAHWTDVVENLAPPGIAWCWDEIDVPYKVKYNWKCDGLIRRAPDGSRWITTMRLWCHVIDQAGPDEPVGAGAKGQQLLADAPGPVSGGPRYLTSNTATRSSTTQVTLIGNTADTTDLFNVAEHVAARTVRRDPTRLSDRDRAAQHPRQARLSTWGVVDRSRWDMTTGTESRLSTPTST